MDNIPRIIFYTSGVFLTSAAFTLFTSEFLVKINDPSITGMLFLLGFGLIYLNIVFVTGRRFMRRLTGPNPMPYIFAFFVAAPPLVWTKIYETGLGESELTYLFTIIMACGIGAYFGHRTGLKAQVNFQKNLDEYLNGTAD